jgi:phage gp36-like protein
LSYAVLDDIRTRYGDHYVYTIADRDGDDAIDTSAVDRILADASGLIDSYLAQRYTLPLTVVPDIIKRLSIDIAVYWLAIDGGGAATDDKRQRYEDAVDWLKMVANGKIDPIGPLSSTVDDDNSDGVLSSHGVLVSSNPRLFSRATMAGL